MGTTALYARLSRDKHEAAGIDRQLADCHDLAKQNGWAPVQEFVDRSISASRYGKKPREAYEAMLAAAERGDVDRIVCYHLDRLYRRPAELEPVIDLADRGLIVATVEAGRLDLTSGAGRHQARTAVSGAALAADDISRLVRRAKQQNRQRGLPHGGRIPFGWCGEWTPAAAPGGRPTFSLTPHPAEVDVLIDAMKAVIASTSLNDIAADWRRRGLRKRRWNGTDVRRVLTLPRHVALVPVGGDVMRDTGGDEVVAQWPAIVPRQLWEDCRAVLISRATGVGIPRRRSWLSGRVFCGACGGVMTHSSSGRRGIWRCWHGRGGCGKVSIGSAPLEAVVLDEMFRYVDDAQLRRTLSTRDDRGVVALRSRLAELERQDADLADAFADRGMQGSAYRAASDRLRIRRHAVNVELGRLTEQSPLDAFAKRGSLRAAWDDLTVDRQRSIVAEVYPRIVIQRAAQRGCRFDASRIELSR